MTQTQAEQDLAALEGPHQEAQNAAADLATLKTLIDTTPHAGARAAMQHDLAAAEKRHHTAQAALAHAGAPTQQDIDRAAQAVIDEREE